MALSTAARTWRNCPIRPKLIATSSSRSAIEWTRKVPTHNAAVMENDDPPTGDADKDDSSSKVICTELHRQGLMNRADYLQGARFAGEHLTVQHYRGYHAWALPVVRHMRRSKRATAFWRALASARADHIAYLNGDTTRRKRLGALLCTIGHPVCYALGGLVKEQDWNSLYTGESSRTAD